MRNERTGLVQFARFTLMGNQRRRRPVRMSNHLLAIALAAVLAGCSSSSPPPSGPQSPSSSPPSMPGSSSSLPSPPSSGSPGTPGPPPSGPSGMPSPSGSPGTPSPPGGTPSPGSPSSGTGDAGSENLPGGPPMPGGAMPGEGESGASSGPAGTEMPNWVPGGTEAAGGDEEWETSNQLPGTADIPPMPSETPGSGSEGDPGLDGDLDAALEDFDGEILAEREIIRERSNENAGTQGSAIPLPSAEAGPAGSESDVDNPGGPVACPVPATRHRPQSPARAKYPMTYPMPKTTTSLRASCARQPCRRPTPN